MEFRKRKNRLRSDAFAEKLEDRQLLNGAATLASVPASSNAGDAQPSSSVADERPIPTETTDVTLVEQSTEPIADITTDLSNVAPESSVAESLSKQSSVVEPTSIANDDRFQTLDVDKASESSTTPKRPMEPTLPSVPANSQELKETPKSPEKNVASISPLGATPFEHEAEVESNSLAAFSEKSPPTERRVTSNEASSTEFRPSTKESKKHGPKEKQIAKKEPRTKSPKNPKHAHAKTKPSHEADTDARNRGGTRDVGDTRGTDKTRGTDTEISIEIERRPMGPKVTASAPNAEIPGGKSESKSNIRDQESPSTDGPEMASDEAIASGTNFPSESKAKTKKKTQENSVGAIGDGVDLKRETLKERTNQGPDLDATVKPTLMVAIETPSSGKTTTFKPRQKGQSEPQQKPLTSEAIPQGTSDSRRNIPLHSDVKSDDLNEDVPKPVVTTADARFLSEKDVPELPAFSTAKKLSKPVQNRVESRIDDLHEEQRQKSTSINKEDVAEPKNFARGGRLASEDETTHQPRRLADDSAEVHDGVDWYRWRMQIQNVGIEAHCVGQIETETETEAELPNQEISDEQLAHVSNQFQMADDRTFAQQDGTTYVRAALIFLVTLGKHPRKISRSIRPLLATHSPKRREPEATDCEEDSS